MTIRLFNSLFQSRPIAAHCPGPLSDRWRRFSAAVLSQPSQDVSAASADVTVLTWNGGEHRSDKPCGVLERSLARLGIRPLVLGTGRSERGRWENRDKLALTAEALQQVRTPFVIGADSCDVVFLDDPQILVDRFRRHFPCDLVFNATGSTCWPPLPRFVQFQSSLPMAAVAQGRHWINSGLFLGRTEFCRDYFRRLAAHPPVQSYPESDQAIVMETWPEWYPRVQADSLSLLFQWFNESPAVLRIERPETAAQSQFLRWIAPFRGPLIGAEVGVGEGHTSEVLLRERPDLRLWMIEPAAYSPTGRVPEHSPLAAAAALFRSAADWTDFAVDRRFLLPESSSRGAERFAPESVDFVVLASGASDDVLCGELLAWWPRIRPGGVLVGFSSASRMDLEPGVRRAVEEFAERHFLVPVLGEGGTWSLEKSSNRGPSGRA